MTSDNHVTGLEPCPFCGSSETSPIGSVVQLHHNEYHREHNLGGDWWTVQCDNCTATMGQFHDPNQARDAWNTRAAIAAMNTASDNGRLREALEAIRDHDMGDDLNSMECQSCHDKGFEHYWAIKKIAHTALNSQWEG